MRIVERNWRMHPKSSSNVAGGKGGGAVRTTSRMWVSKLGVSSWVTMLWRRVGCLAMREETSGEVERKFRRQRAVEK